MKKSMLLAALVLIVAGCGGRQPAVEAPAEPACEFKGRMERLTPEQRACVKAHNCPARERGEGRGRGREEGPRAEARECWRRAFKECGVDRPAREHRRERTRK